MPPPSRRRNRSHLTDTPDRPAPAAADLPHNVTDIAAPVPDAVAPAEIPAPTEAAVEASAPAEPVAEAAPVVEDEPEDDAPEAVEAAEEEDEPEEDEASAAEDESEEEEDDEDDEEEEAEEAAAPRVTFGDLGLSEPILRAVAEAGYVTPTPIQEQAIPIVLMGRDVLGCAQTGTGKTAGFTLPMLDILASGRAKARMPRSLILEPTRELALQVAENFVKYGKHLNLVHALLIGGESMNDQRAVLEKGVDVLIATPGRLLDLFDRGRILLADCKVLVIDEADRMLDMGFIPDVERIVSMLPGMRQTLFFSATMAPEIRKLADAFLQNPKEISVSAPASVATTITTGLLWTRELDKREALRRLIRREDVQNALIFCNRKIDVDILYKSLKRHGFSVGALHGDMDQASRFATLNRFKANELQLLVCSDVAARGIDIGGLSHVFNFDVPFRDEDYVHRIGRTGRAGRQGHAYTIATADDARNVAAIEKLTGVPIPRIEIEGLDPVSNEEIAEAATRPKGRGRGGRDAARGRERERDRGGRGSRPERGERERAAGGRDRDRARPERSDRDRPDRHERSDRDRPERDRGPVRERERERERPQRAEAERGDRYDRGERPERGDRERFERDRYQGQRDDRRRDRDDRRRDRDDLGPAVRGFGDAVPAFMLIPIPRPRRESAAEQEAA
ncbi:DEAD/DEAH box helicase [Roseicella aerolata]|uniref:DEAD-box ATP-dependent RNA helicase RhpA n=1 Tax=Roseicella aerolata TaxID=2883479 RepID=A0A9X1IHE4_9PROT|nr:DEAD/DEAH box helicase [Roseicella aerolata]MCB4824886.1 DEAD/DEAH box helicase [Roseicella aerolata]